MAAAAKVVAARAVSNEPKAAIAIVAPVKEAPKVPVLDIKAIEVPKLKTTASQEKIKQPASAKKSATKSEVKPVVEAKKVVESEYSEFDDDFDASASLDKKPEGPTTTKQYLKD